ncbi:hypothetical protein LTR62_008694 [Meristemomyces frigidus]|uniref:Uncharacterized protein n=1 Tax=Meristemomyces frigidus TaxID=1508187 RepID=A0AAN7TAE1_9PEZI|nr:hypothetical protein LTR62_008694 [Meristemomyces frigidus]
MASQEQPPAYTASIPATTRTKTSHVLHIVETIPVRYNPLKRRGVFSGKSQTFKFEAITLAAKLSYLELVSCLAHRIGVEVDERTQQLRGVVLLMVAKERLEVTDEASWRAAREVVAARGAAGGAKVLASCSYVLGAAASDAE